jgi:hypothetical protein
VEKCILESWRNGKEAGMWRSESEERRRFPRVVASSFECREDYRRLT